VSAPPQRPPGQEPQQNIAAAITEISDRATQLVREEIELAKAEITVKATRIARGAAVGAAAGFFFAMALVMALFGGAWLLYYFLPGNDFTYFWGFFAMALILVILGVGAGLLAARALKRGAPPTPELAIEEAKLIRETVMAQTPAATPPPVGDGASAQGPNGAQR
jgi:MFS family permease